MLLVFLFPDRLDGKKKKTKSISEDVPAGKPAVYQRGIPDYDYKIGTLKFLRNSRPSSSKDNKVLVNYVITENHLLQIASLIRTLLIRLFIFQGQ